jgi:hypothetical protein
MNNIQRRLFRAFVEAGGDLSDESQVDRFIRYVEGTLATLPPRVREAIELVWRSADDAVYAGLSTQFGQRQSVRVTPSALRQRVSRGARLIEHGVRCRRWDSAPLRAGETTAPRLSAYRNRVARA